MVDRSILYRSLRAITPNVVIAKPAFLIQQIPFL